MEISEINNEESLKKWLQSLSEKEFNKITPVLAYRCALREIPNLISFRGYEIDDDSFIISVFRAISICGAFVLEKKVDYFVFSSHILDNYSKPNLSFHFSVFIRAVEFIESSDTKKYDINDFLPITEQLEDWVSFKQDVKHYVDTRDTKFNNTHLWHGKNNIPKHVDITLNNLFEYNQKVPSEHWDIWFKFYEEVIEGRYYFPDSITNQLTTWEDEYWGFYLYKDEYPESQDDEWYHFHLKRTPAIVNKEIKDLCRHFDKLSDPKWQRNDNN